MASKSLILNICGEGEVSGAVNLNNLAALMRPLDEIRKAGELVEGDVLSRWPFADESVDMVIGNNLPGFSAKERMFILREAWRVLRGDGEIRIHTMSGKFKDWEDNMEGVGFELLLRESRGVFLVYAVGRKP